VRIRRTVRPLRIFFATDLHASERCFRKFVAAARFYEVDLLILGGDLAGKRMVVLRRRTGGGYEVQDSRAPQILASKQEAANYEREAADRGIYTTRLEQGDDVSLSEGERLLEDSAAARLESWYAYAEERLAGQGTRIFVIPGNDDPLRFDEILRDSEVWTNCDGKVVEVDGGVQIAGLGCSTPTPWDTPRELPDEEIDTRLRPILASADPRRPLILNVHVPPYGSGLDICPVLDAELRPVLGAGGPLMAPVGSQALRTHILHDQPILGLHGHVHEACGIARIGRTLCANPGSQYSQGRLLGFLASISAGEIKEWAFTEG
jgi:Icc-related predicted phosphoesterase